MPEFSIGDCVRFGWETFKKRPGILIGAFLLCAIIPSIPTLLFPMPEAPAGAPQPPPSNVELIAMLISAVLGVIVALGVTTFALRAHDNISTVTIGDLWNPQPFWRFFGAQLLVTIIIFVGLLLFVVPGIIAAAGLMFTLFMVVDRGAGPINALNDSWQATKGHKWQLFLLGLVLLGLNFLGALALLIGLLVTVPVTWLAVTHAYRTLSAQAVT